MKYDNNAIENKPIEYIYTFSSCFLLFAKHCGASPDEIFAAIEDAIRERHHAASPRELPEHPRTIWYLEAEPVGFYYQVLPHSIEVGDIRALRDGSVYEPSQDLFAQFTV